MGKSVIKDKESKIKKKQNDLKSAAVKKENKLLARRKEWATHVSNKGQQKVLEAASKKAPLSHLHSIKDSLQEVETRIQAEEDRKQKPTKMDINRKRVVSSRGRAMNMNVELENFRKVMKHPVFRQDPVGTIHEHISYTLQPK